MYSIVMTKTTLDFKEFKTFIGSLEACSDEVLFKHNKDGLLTVRGMDASHVCLIDIKYATDISDVQYAVRLNPLWSTLKTLKTPEITYDLDIEKGVIKLGDAWSEMDIRCLVSDEDIKTDLPLPTAEQTQMIEIPFGDLKDICKTIATKSGFITLGNSFSGKGDEGEINIRHPSVEGITEQGTYSLEYLQPMLRNQYNLKKDSKVVITFSQDKPMRISFHTELLKIDFWLAPRCEN